MNAIEKIQDAQRRIEIVQAWQPRLDALKKRKTNPLQEKDFAEKAGYKASVFNRMKNLKNIPSQDNIDTVEAAFEQEGV